MFLFFSFKWSKLVNVPGQNEVLFFKKFPRCYVEMTFWSKTPLTNIYALGTALNSLPSFLQVVFIQP